MRLVTRLFPLLVPAALLAQGANMQPEGAAFESVMASSLQLLQDFYPLKSLLQAETLLPTKPLVFDGSTPQAALKSSAQFRNQVRVYYLAGQAAYFAGYWEKARDYYETGSKLADQNTTQTEGAVAPTIEAWERAIDAGKVALEKNPARLGELQGRKARTTEEDQELKTLLLHQGNTVNGPKVIKACKDTVKDCENLANHFPEKIQNLDEAIKSLADQIEHLSLPPSQARVLGHLYASYTKPQVWAAVILNHENISKCPTIEQKLRLLHRILALTKTSNRNRVEEIIDRVRQKDENPFAPHKSTKK